MAALFLAGKSVTAEAPPSKTYTLLTYVHNDADDANDADNTDNTNAYYRMIGISKCEQNCANTQNHHPPTYRQTSLHEWFEALHYAELNN